MTHPRMQLKGRGLIETVVYKINKLQGHTVQHRK